MGSARSSSRGFNITVLSPSLNENKLVSQCPSSAFGQEDSRELVFPSVIKKNRQDSTIQYITGTESKLLKEESTLYRLSMTDFATIEMLKLSQEEDVQVWKLLEEGETAHLQLGDALRLGEVEVVLKEMVFEEFSVQPRPSSSMDSQKKCRICFESEKQFDPLVNLCKCVGSIKYTHFKCLKKWLERSIKEIEAVNCNEYEYQPLLCDLCKSEIPTTFIHEGHRYSFIEMNELEPPYALLETRKLSARGQKIKSYRIKLYEGITSLIGRNPESAICISNATVSRNHCKLFYMNKQLYVKDLNSTYGTFFSSKHQGGFDFSPEKGVTICLDHAIIKITTREDYTQQISFSPEMWCCASSEHRVFLKLKNKFDESTQKQNSSFNILEVLM